MKFFILIVLLSVFSAGASAGDNKSSRTESPVYDLQPSGDLGELHPENDYSVLRRWRRAIEYSFDTTGLDIATPHTMWVVAFNYPQYCHTTPCSVADFPFVPGHDPRAQATFVNAGGGLSNLDGGGKFTGTVHAARNGVNGSEVVLGPGLLNPLGADIRLVIRSHGQPAGFEELLAALKKYRGGCNAQNLVQPTPCRDYQISIHLPDSR